MKRYFIFGVVSLSMLIAALSGTAVSVAFPQIVSSMNTSLIIAGWVLAVNQLAATAGMPLAGKVGDAYGSKLTFIICIILFTSGSLLCAFAPNVQLLIVFRFIQGLGMGGFLPTGTTIVAEQFHDNRQKYIGFLSSVYAIGQIIGPNLGGWLTSDFGWRSTFWVFVPFGVLTLVAIVFLVPKKKGKSTSLDFTGAVLLTAMLSAFMICISLIGNKEEGIPWVEISLILLVLVILIYIFLWRQSRIKNPIIDIEILREKRFFAANIYNFILGFGLFAITGFIPLYAVSVFDMSTIFSGLVMTPRSISVMISSILISIYLVRWGYRNPMITGTLATAVSLIFMSFANPDMLILGIPVNSFLLLSILMLINGIGQGVTLPAANNACIELMPEKIGTITGVRGMFRQIGGAVGISLMTLVLHNSATLKQGFFLVFFGTGIILILSLPLIFLMPKNASSDSIT